MDWSIYTRSPRANNTGAIPVVDAEVVTRRITTGSFVVETPFTWDRWLRLPPAAGLIIRRGGQTVCSGAWIRASWRQGSSTSEHPAGVIALEGVTDDVIGQYRLAAPNPGLALSNQGAPGAAGVWAMTAPVETVMHALVNLNAGPGARPERRVPGLVMGPDLGRGPVVNWKTLRYPTVQDELRRLAARAEQTGVRLLPVFEQTDLGLTFHVKGADDRTGLVVLGAGLGNLDDQEYIIDAGSAVGIAIAGGKGEGAARLQKVSVQADAFTAAFGTLREVYEDRRDTDDLEQLQEAADDAIADGVASVSFRSVARDTEGTRYGIDFDLNSLATVVVGPEGYPPIATFDDLVRELRFTLNAADGTDVVTAAVGQEGATTGVKLPTLTRLAALEAAAAKLQRSP